MEIDDSWIYFLKLSRHLPRDYFTIDQELKRFSKSLVPISINGLIDSTSRTSSIHIVILIHSVPELRYFNRRAQKLLKYLMQNSMVNLYIASSFSHIGDGSLLKRNQYNFMKLPLAKKDFCKRVSQMIDKRESEYFKWPGGKRPRMLLAG